MSRFVFASCATPELDAGLLPDTAAEARAAYREAGAAATRSGLAFRDILKTRFFFAHQSDFAPMDSVRDPLFRAEFTDGDFPASVGAVTGGRGGERRPFFELEIIAHPDKTTLFAPGVIRRWSGFAPPFTHATVAGGVVFASGQSPYTEDGAIAATDPAGQAAAVLSSLSKVMGAAGCGPDALLYLTVFVAPEILPILDALRTQIDGFVSAAGHASIVTIVPVAKLFRPDMVLAADLYARAPGTTVRPVSRHGRAEAVRHEGLILAKVETASAGDAAAAWDGALSDLAGALAGLGAGLPDLGLTTVWHSRDLDRSVLERAARAALPGSALTIAPNAAPGSTLLVEALGNAPGASS